jgi:hypothetical protein
LGNWLWKFRWLHLRMDWRNTSLLLR